MLQNVSVAKMYQGQNALISPSCLVSEAEFHPTFMILPSIKLWQKHNMPCCQLGLEQALSHFPLSQNPNPNPGQPSSKTQLVPRGLRVILKSCMPPTTTTHNFWAWRRGPIKDSKSRKGCFSPREHDRTELSNIRMDVSVYSVMLHAVQLLSNQVTFTFIHTI